MARSLGEAHPDISTVFIALMQRLSEHERKAREFKEAVQIGLEQVRKEAQHCIRDLCEVVKGEVDALRSTSSERCEALCGRTSVLP